MYRADGLKVKKTYGTKVTDYLDGFQYENNVLQFVPTAEGYYDFANSRYTYNYTDHLGNVRVSYYKGSAGNALVLEENNYYPFGLKHTGYNSTTGNTKYQYKYNGKELQETGMYDYGARFYMPDVGRWGVVDPLSEKHPSLSLYVYCANNPILLIDPDGRDWIKNDKSGKFEWNNDVTKASQTPKGYSYIGSQDTDIVKNLFGGISFSSKTTDVGPISVDDYDNPYSSKGFGVTNAAFTTEMTVSFGADVKTTYDKEGNIASKEFNGVNINVSISGTNTAPSNADIKLSGSKMTLQDNKVPTTPIPSNGTIGIGGDIKTLNYNTYWNANSIQKNYGRGYNLDFKFKGQYMNGTTMLGYPVPGGFAVPNPTNLNLSVKFRNVLFKKILP